MKSSIELDQQVPTVDVNSVPCKVQYTGSSNVGLFFTSSKQKDAKESETVSSANFRGLNLVGEKVDLGDQVGYICNSLESAIACSDDPEVVENTRTLTSIAMFDQFTLYEHDSIPSGNNKWKILSEWNAIADSIHS